MSELLPFPEYHDKQHFESYGTNYVTGLQGDALELMDHVSSLLYTENWSPPNFDATNTPTFHQAVCTYEFTPRDGVVTPDVTEWARLHIRHTRASRLAGSVATYEAFDLELTTRFLSDTNPVIALPLKRFSIEQRDGQLRASVNRIDPQMPSLGGEEDMTNFEADELFGIVEKTLELVEAGKINGIRNNVFSKHDRD